MSNEIDLYKEDETDIFEKIDDIQSMLVQHTFQLDEIRSSLELSEKRKSILLTLEEKTDNNMKRLNDMMLELKGIVAMVRPKVKNTGWYGDEINANSDQNKINAVEIKLIE